jgi:hypothetical protein
MVKTNLFTYAKKIRKHDEAWQDAIKRAAKELRKKSSGGGRTINRRLDFETEERIYRDPRSGLRFPPIKPELPRQSREMLALVNESNVVGHCLIECLDDGEVKACFKKCDPKFKPSSTNVEYWQNVKTSLPQIETRRPSLVGSIILSPTESVTELPSIKFSPNKTYPTPKQTRKSSTKLPPLRS